MVAFAAYSATTSKRCSRSGVIGREDGRSADQAGLRTDARPLLSPHWRASSPLVRTMVIVSGVALSRCR